MGIRYEKKLNKRQCLICGKPATIIYDDWPFCGKKHANEWKQITKKGKRIVHIKPLSSFKFINKDGTTNFKEIKKAFKPENHQWLLAKENLSKNKYGGKKWQI